MLKISKPMKEKENLYRRIILFGVAIAMLALYFEKILWIFGLVLNICMPFLIGGGMGFVLNTIANNLVRMVCFAGKRKENKAIRFFANVGAIFVIVALLLVFALIVVPRVASSMQTIIAVMPKTIYNLYHWAYYASKPVPLVHSWLRTLNADLGNISSMIDSVLQWVVSGNVSEIVGSVYSVVSNTFSILFSSLIAIMFSIIVLFHKKTVVKEGHVLMKAYLSGAHYKKTIHVLQLVRNTFTNYISGTCTECLILGTLVIAFSSLFRMPFAFLSGILVGIGALIPMFGALCAAIISALFIAIESPMQGVYFMILFVCIQQVEGNFIYPNVVGKSVGLPPIYVMVAVTLGANLAGVIGMVLFIPVFSCLYQLIKEDAKGRLERWEYLESEYENE